jgi:hypothetical protein
MDPVFFLLPEGALLGWSESIEDEILVEEMFEEGEHFESDSESRSIDYGDSPVSSADTYLFEEDDVSSELDVVNSGLHVPSEYIMIVPFQQITQSPEDIIKEKLHRDFLACLSKEGNELKEVNSEEDYITSQKFEDGQIAIVISTHRESTEFTYWNNPLFTSTVEKLLASGNTRNPLDNNPIKGFCLVKIKCS